MDKDPFECGITSPSGMEYIDSAKESYIQMCLNHKGIVKDDYVFRTNDHILEAEEGVDPLKRFYALMDIYMSLEKIHPYSERSGMHGEFARPIFPGTIAPPRYVNNIGGEKGAELKPFFAPPHKDITELVRPYVLVCAASPNKYEYGTGSLYSGRVIATVEQEEDAYANGEQVEDADPFGAHKPHEYILRALVQVGVPPSRIVSMPLMPMYPSECEWGMREVPYVTKYGENKVFEAPILMPDATSQVAMRWIITSIIRVLNPHNIIALGYDANSLLNGYMDDHPVRKTFRYARRTLFSLVGHKRVGRDTDPIPLFQCNDLVRATPRDFGDFLSVLHMSLQDATMARVDKDADHMCSYMQVTQAAVTHGWYNLWGGLVAVGLMVQGRTLGRPNADVKRMVLMETDDVPPDSGYNKYDSCADESATANPDISEVKRPMHLIHRTLTKDQNDEGHTMDALFLFHASMQVSMTLFPFFLGMDTQEGLEFHDRDGSVVGTCPDMDVHPNTGLLLVNTLGTSLDLGARGRTKKVVLRGGPMRTRAMRKRKEEEEEEVEEVFGPGLVDISEIQRSRSHVDPVVFTERLHRARMHNARFLAGISAEKKYSEDRAVALARTDGIHARIAKVLKRSDKDSGIYNESMRSAMRVVHDKDGANIPREWVLSIHSRTATVFPTVLLASWHYLLHTCLPIEHTLAWISRVYDVNVTESWVHNSLAHLALHVKAFGETEEPYPSWPQVVVIQIGDKYVVAAPSPTVAHTHSQVIFFKDLMHACGYHESIVQVFHRTQVKGDYKRNLDMGRRWLVKVAKGRFHYPVALRKGRM